MVKFQNGWLIFHNLDKRQKPEGWKQNFMVSFCLSSVRPLLIDRLTKFKTRLSNSCGAGFVFRSPPSALWRISSSILCWMCFLALNKSISLTVDSVCSCLLFYHCYRSSVMLYNLSAFNSLTGKKKKKMNKFRPLW